MGADRGRRRLALLLAESMAPALATPPPRKAMLTLYTFGDSVLDSRSYNERGLDAGQLIVRNDDALFPEFRGHDLSTRGPARRVHRAVDGATAGGLAAQLAGLAPPPGPAVALLTVGGNDLLQGLAADTGPLLHRFEQALQRFVDALPIAPLLLGTVYDPTFGDDRQNFLAVAAPLARRNLARVNGVIRAAARRRAGDRLVDLHAHFLSGRPDWFTRVIEPSLTGASEVRRAFLAQIDPR